MTGERGGVRGRHIPHQLFLPLTLTLSPSQERWGEGIQRQREVAAPAGGAASGPLQAKAAGTLQPGSGLGAPVT
jgi:hypothetical protein